MAKFSRTFTHPFLKWPGGKSGLISQFEPFLPKDLANGTITEYIEPFVGSGAVLFYLLNKYPQISKARINDISTDLMMTYKVIKTRQIALFKQLQHYQQQYIPLNKEDRKIFFYKIRSEFNTSLSKVKYGSITPAWVKRSAQVIFLNRTCFNGLFRYNQKGEFNTPQGDYKNPTIFNKNNLTAVSKILKRTTIHRGDFKAILKYAGSHTFIYLDPPYRPLNRTSSFTSYSKTPFNDAEQIRLSEFIRALHAKKALFMLSNSDPTNEDPTDTFFKKLYKGFHIHTVHASRVINSRADKRGKIKEILVTNYKH